MATKTDTPVKNIYQRIHAVMQKVDYIQKSKPKDGGMKYSSVSHDVVTGAVRPHLVEEGVIYVPQNLVYKQDGNRTEVTLEVHFICVDNPEDKLIVPSFGFGVDNQDKGPGKAVSYAVKYALLKAFGLETGDDPDNESIDHKPQPKPEPVNKILTAEQKKVLERITEIKKELSAAPDVQDISYVVNKHIKEIGTFSEAQQKHINDYAKKQASLLAQATNSEFEHNING